MINVVVLMGRLVADPELKQTPSGVSVTSFRIAVDRNFSNKQTGERQADFINVVAWRSTAEFVCKYFRQGSMIALEGSLQSRSYEDKEGNKRTAYEVVANNVSFTGSKAESGTRDQSAATFEVPATAFSSGSNGDFEVVNDTEDDDLPF